MEDMYLIVGCLVSGFHFWTMSPRRCRIPRQKDEPQLLANLFAIFALVTRQSFSFWAFRGEGLEAGLLYPFFL